MTGCRGVGCRGAAVQQVPSGLTAPHTAAPLLCSIPCSCAFQSCQGGLLLHCPPSYASGCRRLCAGRGGGSRHAARLTSTAASAGPASAAAQPCHWSRVPWRCSTPANPAARLPPSAHPYSLPPCFAHPFRPTSLLLYLAAVPSSLPNHTLALQSLEPHKSPTCGGYMRQLRVCDGGPLGSGRRARGLRARAAPCARRRRWSVLCQCQRGGADSRAKVHAAEEQGAGSSERGGASWQRCRGERNQGAWRDGGVPLLRRLKEQGGAPGGGAPWASRQASLPPTCVGRPLSKQGWRAGRRLRAVGARSCGAAACPWAEVVVGEVHGWGGGGGGAASRLQESAGRRAGLRRPGLTRDGGVGGRVGGSAYDVGGAEGSAGPRMARGNGGTGVGGGVCVERRHLPKTLGHKAFRYWQSD